MPAYTDEQIALWRLVTQGDSVARRFLVLRRRVEQDLTDVDRLVATATKHWALAQKAEVDREVYIDSVALNLHNVQGVLERVFNSIVAGVEGVWPTGDDAGEHLLRQVALDLGAMRPAVLRQETAGKLDELRQFRDHVRVTYSHHLDVAQMAHLVVSLPDLWQSVRLQLTSFLGYLERASLPNAV